MTKIYNTDSTQANYEYGDLDLDSIRANAWVNCGVAADINASYNVSSLVDVGTGQVGVNFIKAFINTSFVCLNTIRTSTTTADDSNQTSANLSTTRTDVLSFLNLALADPAAYNITIIGHEP